MKTPNLTTKDTQGINRYAVGGIAPLLAILLTLLSPAVKAQTTVTFGNPIPIIFGGAGVTNVYPGYTNSQVALTLTGGTDPVDFSVNVVGNPAGVTAGFVPSGLNPNSAANISTLYTISASANAYLSVAVAGAPKGFYPLQIIASNTVTTTTFTNSTTLLVLPNVFMALTNSADTNWSTAANWSAGAPAAGDSVRFEYSNTNSTSSARIAYFDTSIVLDSLELMPKVNNLTVTNYFAPGVTVTVGGTNGFWAGEDNYIQGSGLNNFLLNFSLVGAGAALVVTNPQAPFSMSGSVQQNVVGALQNMSGLDNLYVDVKRAGVGDGFLTYPRINQNNAVAQMGVFSLAKTNFIRATYVGDYSGGPGVMTNSIMFFNSAGAGAGGGNPFINLGISNIFYADSMSGFSQQSAVDASVIRFNPAFTNGNAAVAVFRGTNGGRMSYFGIGVESGVSGFTGRTRGSGFNFTGGTLDMLVDTLVLSQNQTNRNGNFTRGDLTYSQGVVDARVVRLGFQAPTLFVPTLTTGVRATLTVGGSGANAVMTVSDSMRFMEGLYTETAVGSSFARLIVGSGGKVYVNNILWVSNSSPVGGSSIAVNNGGLLVVSNTLCSPVVMMPTLTIQATGALAFNVTLGVTNAYVTNLTDSLGAKLSILSFSGFSPTVPATNAIIHYDSATGAGSHPISMGSYPAGFNNVTLFDNATTHNIEVRVQTNAPAVLRWRGYVNNVWDHNTANWENTNTLAHVAFVNADSVIFDDTLGAPTNISVTEFVIPNSGGTGIYMTNSTQTFAFQDGGGQVGTCSMVKDGSANFTNNAVATANLLVNGGGLRGSGSIGSVTIASGAKFDYAGTINGALSITSPSGPAVLEPTASANSSFTIAGTTVMTNYGTIAGGSMAVNGTSVLVNQAGGLLKSIGSSGSVNVAAGATLLNYGDIGWDFIDNGPPSLQNTLTVSGTFKDMGVGNIYLTTLTINGGGTFIPGGDGIGTTTINNPGSGGTFPGRLLMNQGSTNIIKVNFANLQTNTLVMAQSTDFGGSSGTKNFNGCFIIMTNINPGAGVFAAGQSFRPFTGNGGGDLGATGTGTNTYPVVIPVIPLPNTKWDLTQLRDTSPNGIMNIISFPTTGTNLTFTAFKDGSNVVTHLQWPAEYIGWKLQQQINSLGIGLSNNWVTITASATNNDVYITNGPAIDASFFRMTYP